MEEEEEERMLSPRAVLSRPRPAPQAPTPSTATTHVRPFPASEAATSTLTCTTSRVAPPPLSPRAFRLSSPVLSSNDTPVACAGG
eukprot:380214-Rhodomonas_salina.1